MDTERLIELVLRAQNGDQEAFGELASQFQPAIYSLVLRRLRNHSEAVETTQDVLMQAMRKLDQLREPERFAGWLRQIATRMAINRAVRRPPEATCEPETLSGVSSAPVSPLDHLLQNEAAEQVWGGLNRLRDLDRETLIAFYVEGHSLKEMSDDFDRPIGTIKRRLHTARNRLREELAAMQPA